MTDTTAAPATAWYKSKTIWTGAIVAALGVLDFLQTLPLPPGAMTAVGAVMIVLRALTSGGLSAK